MAQIWLPFISVVIFVVVVLAVQALSQIVFTSRDRERRVNRRLTMLASGMRNEDVYAALVRQPLLPSAGDPTLARLSEQFSTFCRQADVQMSPLRVFAIFCGAAAAIWLFSFVIFRAGSLLGFATHGLISLVASCALSGSIAWMWLSGRRAKRRRAIEEQLPLALDILNRALRAGHPVVSAVKLAADEMGDPIGSEFGLIVDETTYGFEFKDALSNFARRTGSSDAGFFAVAVSIQSETGGNLAEVLEGLAKVMRGRSTLGKRVKALSSEGRASAFLLTVLPIFLVSAISLMHPGYYTSKFQDPVFWPIVAGICVLYAIGWLIIRRIVNFRY